MPCKRCGGFMVVEIANDLLEKVLGLPTDAARCINCGHFEDSTIRANKESLPLPRRAGPHPGGQEAGHCSAK